MKKLYNKPEIDLTRVYECDVLAASGFGKNDETELVDLGFDF